MKEWFVKYFGSQYILYSWTKLWVENLQEYVKNKASTQAKEACNQDYETFSRKKELQTVRGFIAD